ncbi:MAG: YkgJ family cysteine cluster protein, partial [Myxococcales bacterium]|nr:YkgJ family cysteine cluster protein [Myxococcales bacterium]
MLSVPQIPPRAAAISWAVQDGALNYYVHGRAPRPIKLNAGMATIALQADGKRSFAEIYDLLIANGIQVSDPAHVVLVFRMLEQVGAVAMRWHFESSGEIRHTCLGSGHCCQGHVVSSLGDQMIERLHEYKEKLKTLEPELGDLPPIMELHESDGSKTYALNAQNGVCVFLNAERKCAIHKHFGAEAKPVACRLFPLRVVQTEDGFRVGISSRCTTASQTYKTAPALSAELAVEAAGFKRPPGDLVGLDPANRRSLRFTQAYQSNAGQEAFFLALTSKPELTLGNVVASADGCLREAAPPASYLAAVQERLQRFANRFEFPPINLPGNGVGDLSRQLVGKLATCSLPSEWIEPNADIREYLVHSLHQAVFTRDTTTAPTVECGVQIMLIGIAGITQMALASGPPANGVPDELGAEVAMWLRLTNTGLAFGQLFD